MTEVQNIRRLLLARDIESVELGLEVLQSIADEQPQLLDELGRGLTLRRRRQRGLVETAHLLFKSDSEPLSLNAVA